MKPVLEWSDTVLSGKTFKSNILLKYILREVLEKLFWAMVGRIIECYKVKLSLWVARFSHRQA